MSARAGLLGVGRTTWRALAVTLLLSSPSFAKWQQREFLILYSYGWPAEQVAGRLTEQSARRIADEHYNTVMCTPSELALVAKAGLSCLVIGWSQGAPDYIGSRWRRRWCAASPQIRRFGAIT